MTKAVAILTTFQDLPTSYGLVPVVLNQIKQLVDKGWEVGFYTQAGFESHIDAGDTPAGCELIPRVPFTHLYHYFDGTSKQKHDVDGVGHAVPDKPFAPITNFDKQVKMIDEALDPWLSEYPVVITHDILFQVAFVAHNQAIRNIGKRHPEIRWLHWLHSGPSPRPDNPKYPHTLRYERMENSLFISPNNSMRQKFAEMYDIPLGGVRTVYHIFDPVQFFEMHPLSAEIARKHKLYSCDALVVWPTRVDAPGPKGMYHAIRLVSQMNKFANVKFLFLNSWSSSDKAKKNIKSMKKEAQKWGLPKGNLIFSSEIDKKYENGVPHQVVKDMMMIGNMFILPSETETFSLAMVEAAACKNMVVLNESLDVFTELGEDRVDYVRTDSDWGGKKDVEHYWGPERNCPDCGTLCDIVQDNKYFMCPKCRKKRRAKENPEHHWREKAHKLLGRLGFTNYHCEHCEESLGKVGAYNPLRQQRHILKHFSADWTYRHQLEPLLLGDWEDA